MRKKQLTSILLSSMMVLSAAGCSSSNTPATTTPAADSSAAATTAAETSEPAAPAALDSVTMLVNYKATEAPADDNPLILAINEYTGTKLNVMWVPQDAFEEKINTLMASQQLPMITVIRENKSSGFINAARSGMFWDLSPYISQFENLSKISYGIHTYLHLQVLFFQIALLLFYELVVFEYLVQHKEIPSF